MSEASEQPKGTCEVCGRQPAQVHVRLVDSASDHEQHVCLDCARDMGAAPTLPASSTGPSDPLTTLLSGIQETHSAVVCPGCAMTHLKFQTTGRLGCSRCYDTFAKELRPLLGRMHGSTRHRGRVPSREGEVYEQASRIRRLNEELERAVGAEDYERAAELRDRLADLQLSAGGSKDSGPEVTS